MPRPAREVAVAVVRTLRESGHIAYLAGGCVRDELLALHPKDYDVATDAAPERIAALFKRTRGVGKAFGVMQVQDSGVTVEVATFRREHGYSDRRRPDRITFVGAEEDARRRDFTINALFIDPLAPASTVHGVRIEGAVIDFVSGLADLERRIIRAVGDPEARLAEDNLRALRAVRFTARLAFTLDPATADAVRRHAAELAGVSRERIGDEMRRMLADPRRADAVELIENLGLDAPVLNAPPRQQGNLAVLRSLDGPCGFPTALSAWAIDRALPEMPDADLASRWRAALCLSNDESSALRTILASVPDLLRRWNGHGIAKQKRAASSWWFHDSLRLLEGIDPAAAAAIRGRVRELSRTPSGISPTPLVTGDDLVAAGLRPGPGFGAWLDAVYDAQLEDRLTTREEAVAMAKRLSAGH